MTRFLIGSLLILGWSIVGVASPPVAAETAGGVVITHIMAGVSGAATQEFVSIYNNSDQAVDISGWCLINKSDDKVACFEDDASPLLQYILPSYASALVVSAPYLEAHPQLLPTIVYEPTSQSSGSLVGSSDTLQLIDSSDIPQDEYQWTSSWAGGTIMQRKVVSQDPILYQQTGLTTDWVWAADFLIPVDQVSYVETVIEPCQSEGSCPVEPLIVPLKITELLANSAGSDEGKEFIELYNPTDDTANLGHYSLLIGYTSQKTFALSPDTYLLPGEYLAIYNNELAYTLVNTTSQVQLLDMDGTVIDQTDVYESPKDDESWALFETGWLYTNRPTPGATNLMRLEDLTITTASATATTATSDTLKPCAANQYRNPETNRCRKIVSPSQPTPCSEGYYRSAETNRCRKLATAAVPTPCKEGQERNPETGRCRKLKAMTAANYEVLGATVEEQPQQWYVIWVIIAVVGALVLYGAWEWRHDIAKLIGRLQKLVVRRK